MWHICCDGEEKKGKGERTGGQIPSDTFRRKFLTFQTEEEASQDITQKMSNNFPSIHGQNVHVTKDEVMESLRQSSWEGGERGKGEVGGPAAKDLGQVGGAGLHLSHGVLAGQ